MRLLLHAPSLADFACFILPFEASADSDAITDLEPMTHLEVLEFTAGTNYAYVEVLSGEKKSYKGYVNSDYITKLGEPTVRIGTEE